MLKDYLEDYKWVISHQEKKVKVNRKWNLTNEIQVKHYLSYHRLYLNFLRLVQVNNLWTLTLLLKINKIVWVVVNLKSIFKKCFIRY